MKDLVVIHDKVANLVSDPISVASPEVALRYFAHILAQNPYAKDMELLVVGRIDEESGRLSVASDMPLQKLYDYDDVLKYLGTEDSKL